MEGRRGRMMADMVHFQLQASNQMLGELFNQTMMLRAENLALRATIAELQKASVEPEPKPE